MNSKELEEHVKMLKENMAKGLSKDEQIKAMNHSLKREGFLFDLKEHLEARINGEISPKLKERYNTARSYFELREKIENQIIASEDWISYFQNVSVEELKNLNLSLCSSRELKILMLITIQALKSFIDNSEEESEKCRAIHELYLKLKSALSSQIAFPKGDSFLDYLNLRTYREEIEETRISGSICPSCSSHDIKSFGQNWKCRTCGREFRKHMQRRED
jgi:hypothetical protein